LHLTAQDDLLLQNGTLNARFGSRVQSVELVVGLGATAGTLNVTAGADVESESGAVNGAATVDGNGSTWNVSTSLGVGVSALGRLNVTGAGSVTAEEVRIGDNSGSTGTVTVAGNGSFLRISDDLNMLSAGSGTLRIQTGGLVQVGIVTSLGNGDAIHLDGGSLQTRVFHPSQGQFNWTSGRLGVQRFDGNLTAPNGGVLGRFADPQVEVTGQLTLLAGSTAEIVFSTFVGTTQIQANASAVIDGGNLRLVLDPNFPPSAQAVFELMTTVGGVFGSFANAASGQRVATSDGLGSFLVHYGPGSPFNPTSVFISSYLPAMPGDFDIDGDVDGRDFLIWQRGASPTPGSVADLAAWRVNFGAGGSAAASAAVPEPAAAWLAMAAIAVACACRKC
jgi:T5SS/PEP-CTERM-associated repeat protein